MEEYDAKRRDKSILLSLLLISSFCSIILCYIAVSDGYKSENFSEYIFVNYLKKNHYVTSSMIHLTSSMVAQWSSFFIRAVGRGKIEGKYSLVSLVGE